MSQLKRRGSHLKNNRKITLRFILILILVIIAIVLIAVLIFGNKEKTPINPNATHKPGLTPELTPGSSLIPTDPPLPEFTAYPVESTMPSVFGFKSELNVDGKNVDSYTSEKPIIFSDSDSYTKLEGIISFRGNNFRNSSSYGVVSLEEKTLEKLWNIPTNSLQKGESNNYKGAWTGSGWTGQPIIVKWPKETKAVMNMYDTAKADDNLVEVIYATMDGNVYFLDLNTGKNTRDTIHLGVPFKGAGSLDPRGYPLLYLGSGDHYNQDGKRSRAMVLSLITGKIIYDFGTKPDPYALRAWTAWDSSALVNAETDTLIYPGENGVLYVLKLNTKYDPAAGTISVDPSSIVKFRYSATRTRNDGYWIGYEGSASAYKNYLFLTENSGLIHCVDLNTMKVVWVQDIWDDTNCSPLFELGEDGKGYLYIGSTLDNRADSSGKGTVAFFKLSANTGEVIWKQEREVYTTKGVTGGVMSCAILGKGNLDGMVFTAFASYGNGNNGELAAFNKDNGDLIWSTKLSAYTWCSPSAIYDKDNNGYIVITNYSGNVYLINGKTGDIIYTYNIESNIEASPAVYNNTIVIGTRVQGIFGISIK
ncbi:MAG: PQQ-binding-like beta-propeller repeat protein [Clostridia bacterium]